MVDHKHPGVAGHQKEPQHYAAEPQDREERPHTEKDDRTKTAKAAADGVIGGLVALDAALIAGTTAPPGSGLFALLSQLAVQLTGAPRTAFPAPAQNDPGAVSGGIGAAPPGVPPASPPGPLAGQGRGQSPTAAASSGLAPQP